jgi:hypothetical protein
MYMFEELHYLSSRTYVRLTIHSRATNYHDEQSSHGIETATKTYTIDEEEEEEEAERLQNCFCSPILSQAHVPCLHKNICRRCRISNV